MTYTFTHDGFELIRNRTFDEITVGDRGIDSAANRANAHRISQASSPVRVAVEPTNEEWIAASHALAVVRARSPSFSQALV